MKIKFNKMFFSVMIACVLAPAVAFAAVYFIRESEDKAHITAPNKPKPCSITHPIRTCPDNKSPVLPCTATGEGSKWFKKCECDTTLYTVKPQDCTDNKSLLGNMCDGKYEGCDCEDSYKFYNNIVNGNITSSNCAAPKVAPTDSGFCIKDGDASNRKLYKDCFCPSKYSESCNYPFVGKGTVCENRYEKCKCGPEFFTCGGTDENSSGGGKGESCTDENGTKYKRCFGQFDKMKFFIVDGMTQGAGKSCTDSSINNGIPNAEVTFRKNQEATVFAKGDEHGVVETHVPFGLTSDGSMGGDDDSVTIEIRAEDYATIISTCPCNGKVYPLIPIGKNSIATGKAATIVLSWNNYVSDLDSHLLDGKTNGHVYFSNKNITGARLDVDDVSCWGPETTTIDSFTGLGYGNNYYYSVLKFGNYAGGTGPSTSYSENDMVLSQSGAEVYLYIYNTLVKVFRINRNEMGTLWNVFKINSNGEYTTINSFRHPNDGSTNVKDSMKY